VTSRRTLVICAVLGMVVVVAAGVQGAASSSGVRWVIDWTPTPRRASPQPQPSLPPPVKPPPRGTPSDGDDTWWRILLWVAVGVVVVVAALLLWRWLAGRPLRSVSGLRGAGAPHVPPDPIPEPEPDVPELRSGVEEALRLLDTAGEPSDAVMRAWLGLQRTAEDSGILRRAAETPTEFTSRIMSRVSADDRAIRTLLTLYLRTRFGEHPVTAADVARVRVALEELARSWDDSVAMNAGSSGVPTSSGAPSE